jgi:hypothetical protein
VRDEIGARNMAIAKLQTGLDNKDVVIANLESQLSGAVAELKEREQAIAKLNSEIESRGNTKQLTPFPGQELTPFPGQELTPIPPPKTNIGTAVIESPQITGTLTRGELLKYILEKFPDSGMEDHNIGDAVAGKTKRLSEFEAAYGFKYLGKIKGKNRFQLV